ncbi:ceramide glucosyltransferase [Nocardioides sp. J9]|uniref:glycosyltransferase n=1 Tax=unclassified Nocardioides TaxID=2615069 RepID=UPI0004B60E3F|nr:MULTISPECIES: glycosyltransferase [unclassified Nocardioides]TWH01958.1 ceramide glucosyltransferase [Nocardioides sp. J9]
MSGRGVVTAAAAGYLALHAGKAATTLRSASRAPSAVAPDEEAVAQVVVVQPILSGDPGLEDALRDNLLALAGARFCWLVDEDDAEAQRVVGAITAQLARSGEAGRVEAVTCPAAPDGVNPKLAKLQPALDAAADDEVFLVLDDDTRLPRESLGALLAGLERATLATGLPAYLPGSTVWAQLVEQFVDNNAAMTYLTLDPVTINGMTWAMRVRDLRALGGFTPLLRNLTDDLAVARAVLAGGGTICQTASPQWITTTVAGPGAYVRLMHRWMLFANLLLRRQPARTVAAISALHGVHPTLLWTVLLGSVRQRRLLPLVTVLGGRAALLRVLQRRIYGRPLHRPGVSLASELVQPLHLGHGAVQRTIRWRTRTYRVRSDDDFAPVDG